MLTLIISTNQSISFNETKNRLKVPADTAAAGTVQWQSYIKKNKLNKRKLLELKPMNVWDQVTVSLP